MTTAGPAAAAEGCDEYAAHLLVIDAHQSALVEVQMASNGIGGRFGGSRFEHVTRRPGSRDQCCGCDQSVSVRQSGCRIVRCEYEFQHSAECATGEERP